MSIREFATRLSKTGFIENDDPINESAYLPVLDWKNERVGWRERAERGSEETVGESLTTEQLADRLIERLLERHGGVYVD